MTTLVEELQETQTISAVTCNTTITSLYDLIAALNADIPPDEDDAVIATVLHLSERGRLRRLPHPEKHDLHCASVS